MDEVNLFGEKIEKEVWQEEPEGRDIRLLDLDDGIMVVKVAIPIAIPFVGLSTDAYLSEEDLKLLSPFQRHLYRQRAFSRDLKNLFLGDPYVI